MKHTIKLFALLAAVVSLVACKPEEGTDMACEREIFYTVSENPVMSVLSGQSNTVHINTEAEWDIMLDRFCDFTQEGVQVMFCSTRTSGQSQSKGLTSDAPTTITTSSREELKAWMKEMEKAGRTVNVSYDNGNGTWSGTAYANLSQEGVQTEVQDYSGVLAFIATPVLDNPPLGGLVMALQVGNDTYIITVHGMMLWFDNNTQDNLMQLLDGSDATLRGTVSSHSDLNGDTFFSIDLEIPEDGVIEF